ncbi:MAG: EutN/CcmL family microcompartment protein [Planctomycetes bacterium]|nr:EutN/CcmL family microcompartment protein [Planctomycetota bacterium]
MFLAQVVGTVVSPVQIPILERQKLLLLRPVGPDGKPSGKTRIGIDRAQAGVGDRVLVIDEGNSGRQIMGDPKGAVKTIVVGIVDYVEAHGVLAYDAQRRD